MSEWSRLLIELGVCLVPETSCLVVWALVIWCMGVLGMSDSVGSRRRVLTSIATAAKQPSSKPQGFDERSSYLGIAYF